VVPPRCRPYAPNATSSAPLQKALAYFEGGDLDALGEETRRRLVAEATLDLRIAPPALRSTRLD